MPRWANPFWEEPRVKLAVDSTRASMAPKVVFRHTGFRTRNPSTSTAASTSPGGLIVARLKEVVESGGVPNPALSASRPDGSGVDVVTEVVIRRPRDDAAAFAVDPDNATRWYKNITSVDGDRHRRCRSARASTSSRDSWAAS